MLFTPVRQVAFRIQVKFKGIVVDFKCRRSFVFGKVGEIVNHPNVGGLVGWRGRVLDIEFAGNRHDDQKQMVFSVIGSIECGWI